MFTLYERTAELMLLDQQAKEIVATIIATLKDLSPTKTQIPAGHCFTSGDPALAAIVRGFARVDCGGSTIGYLHVGDILGWQSSIAAQVVVRAESPIEIAAYPVAPALESSSAISGLWQQFINNQLATAWSILGQVLATKSNLNPEIRWIPSGQAIIIQDTTPTEVFSLLQGKAFVFCGETKVGTVLEGELFGAAAAVADAPRSASVIAANDCVVAVYHQDHFRELLRTHPQTVQRLLATLSRVISTQNEKIVGMTN